MSQRLSLVVQLCTLAACAALVFVAWQMQEGQRTQQEAFLAALAKLTEPRETKPAAPPETRLAVQLKKSSPDQSFPETATLTITGAHLSNNEVKDHKYFDPETGRIDFGRIPPGAYSLDLLTMFGSATHRIEVEDGESHVEQITLPQSGEQIPLTLAIDRPPLISQEDWDRAGLCFFASFERLPFDVDGVRWKSPQTNVQVLVDDKVSRVYVSPALLNALDDQQTQDPQTRALFLEDMNRRSRFAFEQEHITKWPVVAPLGARYRLTRIGLITHPVNFQSRPSIDDLKNPPFAVIWDNSHPDFPAWAKAKDNVFVVGNDESAPWNQQMLPWRIDIPEAMAREVLAQIKQNAELAATRVVQEREIAEQKALAMAAKERASRGPTQNRVRLRFVEGTEDGPAVRPDHLALAIPSSEKPLSPVLDDNGWADFGYLDAGLYTLQVQLTGGARTSRRFVVHPQKDYEETIVCPPEPMPISKRRFVVPLPENLRHSGVRLQLMFESPPAEPAKWPDWNLQIGPFARQNELDWIQPIGPWFPYVWLTKLTEKGLEANVRCQPLRIRLKSAQLLIPESDQLNSFRTLDAAPITDQPWIDLGTSSDEPIVINVPRDLLVEAEAVLKSLRFTSDAAAAPTPQ